MSQKNSSSLQTPTVRHGNFDNDDLDAVLLIADRYKTEFKRFFFALVGVQHDAHDYIG
jgi:hypothetical protein